MAITSNFTVELPVANALKFTIIGEPNNQRANFDQVKLSRANFTAAGRDQNYYQIFEKSDPLRPQVYTNFPKRKVQIVDCEDNVLFDSELYLGASYRGLKYRSQCNFTATEDGKLVIYFTEGFEYSDSAFTIPGDYVVLDGRLPNINAKIGDVVRYNIQSTGIQVGVIADIVWMPALQAEGYMIDVPAAFAEPVPGVMEVTYNEKDVDLFYIELLLNSLVEDTYYVKLLFGITDFEVIKYISEPLVIKELDEDTLCIDYRHNGEFDDDDKWAYLYLNDWFNRIRLNANFHEVIPGGEIQNYTNDYGVLDKTRTVPSRQLKLNMFVIPGWVADKLNVVWGHDSLIINEYYWELKDFGQFNIIKKNDYGDYEITLQQKNDRRVFTKQVPVELTASFTPDIVSDLQPEGDSFEVVFHTNSGATFSFVELPSWLHTDVSEFEDGDTITFTVDENESVVDDRSVHLVAATSDISGLTAEMDVEQNHAATPPGYLEVSSNTVTLNAPNLSFVIVSVTSSGDYDISYLGVTTFPTIKQSGFSEVKISVPSANPGPGTRTGTVRLTLQSNPTIFQDIAVTQLAPPPPTGLISRTPSGHTFSSGGGTFLFDIDCAPACRWQATSAEDWIYVDPSVIVGPDTINVFVNGRDPDPIHPGSRFGSVIITNIDNPSDTLTINITELSA